ncbi:MAG: PA2778 family cysteine peptidase [Pseudomonadota bacterium]
MNRLVGILAALLALAGCAGRQTEALLAAPDGLPPVAEVASVPFHPQADKACGPASLAMVLAWSGLSTSPDSLSTQVYTPGREGSLAPDMVAAARRQGRLAVPVHGLRAVLAELAAGHPVVVFQNLGLEMKPLWHFAVAIGYDLPGRRIILHSGLDERLPMALDTFEHTWDRTGRWAMVVLPPDRLPATAGEREVVEAAAGLERVGLAPAAARAYQAVLDRWPDSLAAALGLGNARYGMGDPKAAEAAFRTAARRHPDAAAAWNNWAHVLLELGRVEEAGRAAERAMSLGGRGGPYAATWESVQDARVSATSPDKAR